MWEGVGRKKCPQSSYKVTDGSPRDVAKRNPRVTCTQRFEQRFRVSLHARIFTACVLAMTTGPHHTRIHRCLFLAASHSRSAHVPCSRRQLFICFRPAATTERDCHKSELRDAENQPGCRNAPENCQTADQRAASCADKVSSVVCVRVCVCVRERERYFLSLETQQFYAKAERASLFLRVFFQISLNFNGMCWRADTRTRSICS